MIQWIVKDKIVLLRPDTLEPIKLGFGADLNYYIKQKGFLNEIPKFVIDENNLKNPYDPDNYYDVIHAINVSMGRDNKDDYGCTLGFGQTDLQDEIASKVESYYAELENVECKVEADLPEDIKEFVEKVEPAPAPVIKKRRGRAKKEVK